MDEEQKKELTISDIKKMSSKEINDNWEQVKKVLEKIKE